MGVPVEGLAAVGARVTISDAEKSRYVQPTAQRQQVAFIPPEVGNNAVAIPPMAQHVALKKPAQKIDARSGAAAGGFAQSFINTRSLDDKIPGIERLNIHDRPAMREYFINRAREDKWTDQVAEQAPALTNEQRDFVVREMIARNVMRMVNSQAGGPADGFKRLNAVGYFLAVAAAHRGETTNDAEVLAARRVYAQVAAAVVEASKDADGNPTIDLAAAQNQLNKAGNSLNNSTQGWDRELPNIPPLAFVTLPSPASSIGLAESAAARHASGGATSPLTPITSDRAQFQQAVADSDRERALVKGQEKAIVAARLAARYLAEGKSYFGGPVTSIAAIG